MMPKVLVRTLFPLLLLTAALLLIECGGSEVIANNGGSEVIARLVSEDGEPVAGAQTRVLKISRRDSSGVMVADTEEIATTVTDDSGKCTFQKLDQVHYYLSASYQDDSLILAPVPFISDADNRVDLGTLVMQAPGAIRGVVLLTSGGPESDIHCYIAGTSFGAITNSTSSGFTITGIFPVDTSYTLTISADGYKRVEITNVEVEAGTVSILSDTIRLELDPDGAPTVAPKGLTVSYDTVSGAASVLWNTVTVDDVERYIVYCCSGSTCSADTVGDTTASLTIFSNQNDTIAKTVHIQVAAFDNDNNEGPRCPFDTLKAIPPAWMRITTSIVRLTDVGTPDSAYVVMTFSSRIPSVVGWTWWADDPDSVIASRSGKDLQSGSDTIVWLTTTNKKRLYVSLTDDRGEVTVDSIDARSLLPIDVWTTSDSLLRARCYAGAAAVDGKIIVYGGGLLMQTASYQFTIIGQNTVEQYDPATGTWSRIASMKQRRYMAASAVVDGKIYVFGGTDGAKDLATVERYDPAVDSWEIVDTMEYAMAGACAAVVNGKIYLTGGLTGTSDSLLYLTTITAYDPADGTWEHVGTLTNGRQLHQTVVVDGRLVTIGGLGITDNSGIPSVMENVECSNVDGGSCPLTMTTLQSGRCRFGAVAVADKLVLLGGAAITTRIEPLGTVEVFSMEGDGSVAGSAMPVALEGMAVVAVDGRIYSIGGITLREGTPETSRAVYVYYP